MNIYLSHSRNFDYQKEFYEPIKHSELVKDHAFIFPHEESDTPFPTRQLFEGKGCDLIIAEVSYPATGQGIELGWADLLNIPIVCIYKEGVKTAGSLHVVTSKFLMYTSSENMIEDITGVVKSFD